MAASKLRSILDKDQSMLKPSPERKFVKISGIRVKKCDYVLKTSHLTQIGRPFLIGKRRFCVCECSCGTHTCIDQKDAISGKIVSCGCRRFEKGETHQFIGTPIYEIWVAMKQRCMNPNSTGYNRYGGKGISVCERWANSFIDFMNDMGPRPSKGHTVDRIDSSLGYSPGNCRWATWHVQSRNKSTNFMISAFGETKCVTDWLSDSRCSLKSANSIRRRILMGALPEEAITRPRGDNRH